MEYWWNSYSFADFPQSWSGILERHPEIDSSRIRLGRFGIEIRPDERVRDGDRIEILRPLVMGPMEARRLRARRKRGARKVS